MKLPVIVRCREGTMVGDGQNRNMMDILWERVRFVMLSQGKHKRRKLSVPIQTDKRATSGKGKEKKGKEMNM